ncbi:MAG: hypothetical protein P8N50_12655, partial [Actinomycetota bacterium]|nr:hypothetical protein [Actinomycetota bacterium]
CAEYADEGHLRTLIHTYSSFIQYPIYMEVETTRDVPVKDDAPSDDDLTLAQSVAWDVYCVGRLVKAGVKGQRNRRVYQFRNRHGFTDAADAAFDELWTASGLTWTELETISAAACEASGLS